MERREPSEDEYLEVVNYSDNLHSSSTYTDIQMIKPIYIVIGVILALFVGINAALYTSSKPKVETKIPPAITNTTPSLPEANSQPSTSVDINIIPATKDNRKQAEACTRDALKFCKVEYLSYSANTKIPEQKILFQKCMSRHKTELSKQCRTK